MQTTTIRTRSLRTACGLIVLIGWPIAPVSGQPAEPPTTAVLVQRRCQLAYVLLWKKDFKAAEEEFRKVLAADEGHDEARLGLALTLERAGKLPEALPEFQRVPADSAHFPEAAAGQARILASQKKYEAAIKLYEQLKAKSPLTDEYRLHYCLLYTSPSPRD